MNLQKTKKKIEKAINSLLESDLHLLQQNLSERSIAHKLAYYLTNLFENYHVDCEYNGDVSNDGLKKILQIPHEIMEELAVRSVRENDAYNIFPDVIVHKRMTNEKNHLVIEIKKINTYQKLREYDLVKLKAFTSQYNYNLGVFLEFGTDLNAGNYNILYFQNGEQREEDSLLEF